MSIILLNVARALVRPNDMKQKSYDPKEVQNTTFWMYLGYSYLMIAILKVNLTIARSNLKLIKDIFYSKDQKLVLNSALVKCMIVYTHTI